jgi:hypothetical protein
MLHDGENHEVWRPGMRRTRKVDSQVCNKYISDSGCMWLTILYKVGTLTD